MYVSRISSFGSSCSAHRLGPSYASVIIWYNAHTCHVYPTLDNRGGKKSWNQMIEKYKRHGNLQTQPKVQNRLQSKNVIKGNDKFPVNIAAISNTQGRSFFFCRFMMQRLPFLKLPLLPLLVLCVCVCVCVCVAPLRAYSYILKIFSDVTNLGDLFSNTHPKPFKIIIVNNGVTQRETAIYICGVR